jgi:uncharacterized membrane protein
MLLHSQPSPSHTARRRSSVARPSAVPSVVNRSSFSSSFYDAESAIESSPSEDDIERLPLIESIVTENGAKDTTTDEVSHNPLVSPPSRRVLSIDLLRGVSVIGMVLVHFMIYYGNDRAMKTSLYFALSDGIGNVGAAVFLVLSGMSHALALESRRRKNRSNPNHGGELRHAWSRALKLLGVELLMLALAWGPKEMIKWDILTLQASSTLVLHACRNWSSPAIALLGSGIALATPALRSMSLVSFESAWGGGFREAPFAERYVPGLVYDPVAGDLQVRWNLGSILQGYTLTGIFPLFPWLLFPLVGHVMGRRVVERKFDRDVPIVAVTGATFAVLGIGLALYSCHFDDPSSVVTGYLSPLSFYPDSFTMVLIQVGVVLAVIPLSYYYFDVLPSTLRNGESGCCYGGAVQGLLLRTSRWALPVYFAHYLLVSWPLAIRYYWVGDGSYLIFQWMDAPSALGAGMIAVALILTAITAAEEGWSSVTLLILGGRASRGWWSRPANCRGSLTRTGPNSTPRTPQSRLSRRLSTVASRHSRRLSLVIPVY